MRALLAAALTLTACSSTNARFVKADAGYQPRQAAAAPEVFLDRRPPRPYRVLGVIEVTGSDTPLDLAVEKGREVGCELLVARGIHDLYGGLVGVTVLAQTGNPPGGFSRLPQRSTIIPPERGRNPTYICGAWVPQ